MNQQLADELRPLPGLFKDKLKFEYGEEFKGQREALKQAQEALNQRIPTSKVNPSYISNPNLAKYDSEHYRPFPASRLDLLTKLFGFVLILIGILFMGVPLVAEDAPQFIQELLQYESPATFSFPQIVSMILGVVIIVLAIIWLTKVPKKIRASEENQKTKYSLKHLEARENAYQKDLQIYQQCKKELESSPFYLAIENNKEQIDALLKKYPIPKEHRYELFVCDMLDALVNEKEICAADGNYVKCQTFEHALQYAKSEESYRQYEVNKIMGGLRDDMNEIRERRRKEFQRECAIRDLERAIDDLEQALKK